MNLCAEPHHNQSSKIFKIRVEFTLKTILIIRLFSAQLQMVVFLNPHTYFNDNFKSKYRRKHNVKVL